MQRIEARALLSTPQARGAAITVFGLGTTQVLRLASNLALTRILSPEIFGIGALLNMLVIGLYLMSHVGADLAVIQDKHGDDPSFLNTAWTIEVLRGVALTVIGGLIAYPFSLFYEEPMLLSLAPVASAALLIQGLASTSLYSATRHLRLFRMIMLDLLAQVVGFASTLALALWLESAWALAVGPLGYRLARTIFSHLFIPGYRAKLEWNADAARSIYNMGRWVMISTAITFFATRIDIALIAKLLPLERVGVYAVAGQLATLPIMVSDQLSNQVLLPTLAAAYRAGHAQMVERFQKTVRLVLPVLLIGVLGTALIAPYFFRFLYDGRYHDAGWMTQLMMIGVWFAILSEAHGRVLQAIGDVSTIAFANATKLIVATLGAFLGHEFGGTSGFILGCGAGAVAGYAVVSYALLRHQVSGFRKVLVYTTAGLVIGVLGSWYEL